MHQALPAGDFSDWLGAMRAALSGGRGMQVSCGDCVGYCPMFGAGGCSIYSHRPETCRTYDCRIFTAAGMSAGEGRNMINERIARWSFEYSHAGLEEHAAVKAAAAFLRQHPVRFPGGHIPSRPAEIAVLAVKSYTVFMSRPANDAEAAAGIVRACKEFDEPGT